MRERLLLAVVAFLGGVLFSSFLPSSDGPIPAQHDALALALAQPSSSTCLSEPTRNPNTGLVAASDPRYTAGAGLPGNRRSAAGNDSEPGIARTDYRPARSMHREGNPTGQTREQRLASKRLDRMMAALSEEFAQNNEPSPNDDFEATVVDPAIVLEANSEMLSRLKTLMNDGAPDLNPEGD